MESDGGYTMAMYGSRRDRSLDDDPNWERLMLKGIDPPRPPRPAHVTEPQPAHFNGPQPAHFNGPEPAQDVARLRKASPVNSLLPTSLKWLKSVPEQARPVALATRYARIVNALAHQWNDDEACRAYFDGLLVDRRGNRQGFPAAVQADIRILQEYFLHSRHPRA